MSEILVVGACTLYAESVSTPDQTCNSFPFFQALLVRYIGGLRRNTAQRTDERVRLTGEVVQGSLAMKMLAWEGPFTEAINNIRKQEVSFSSRMAQIKGLNFALQFCVTPVVSFITFGVYKALNGQLNVPSVFYALALMQLPKLYTVYFFVLGKSSSSWWSLLPTVCVTRLVWTVIDW